MYPPEPEDNYPIRKFPKVPLERRVYAFLVDFIAVWFVSSFASGNPLLQALIFLGLWWVLRVLVVEKNRGQSLGRWAFDMKVIDDRARRIPGILELTKREGILGAGAVLMMIGLSAAIANPLSLILLISPLAADCGMAIGDDIYYQTFHDRIGGTFIVQTRRGFSLDLRLKKLWYQIKRSRQR